jgi:hypothetical protein
MSTPDTRIAVSHEELANLEDCKHKLSTFVTALVYHVNLLPEDYVPRPVSERLLIVTGLATRTMASLQKLMEQLGQIQDSKEQRRIEKTEAEDAKDSSQAQPM